MDKTKENAPDYQIVSVNTETEVGAGWHEFSERTTKPYISIKLDDPAFAYPILGALNRTETGEYHLNWTRPKAKKKGATNPNGKTL